MQASGATKEKSSKDDESPLSRLAAMLDGDMKEINKTIIARMGSDVPLIPQIASYLIAAGGKRIRPLLTIAASRMYGCMTDRPYPLAASVEFIHTATLLHDDVVDESDLRRGRESAHKVFGNQASVLVGDFLFSRAFQLMVEDGSLDALRILSDASAVIAQGEVMQLGTARNLETNMSQYLDVISAKTAALFAAACEIGPVMANAKPEDAAAMCEYGMNLGIAFQIIDDLLDYGTGGHAELGKNTGDDFREGKMTAPVVLALTGADGREREFWKRTMEEKRQEAGDYEEACAVIARHNAMERGRDMAKTYGDKARLALAEAPDSPLRALLDELVTFTIDRTY